MNWMTFCMAISVAFVSAQMSKHDDSDAQEEESHTYDTYDTELSSAINGRKVRRRNERSKTKVTHRQIEVLYTETTTTRTTTEERKLRYNEKVYLPEVRGAENTTSESKHVLKNNISIDLMNADRMYEKEVWNQICEPLIGTAHPDGPLDYFDAIQAMRPPNTFPANNEEPTSVKFFGEKRYPVTDRSLHTIMKTFLRCLLSVVSHVADDSKRRKMTKMFYTSIIGWLKDSLLIDLYSLPERPERTIIDIEDIVEALVYMREKHFVPDVAKEALRTYEFISVGDDDHEEAAERERGFQVTTAILVTLGVAFLFVLVLLSACVAAAVSSPAMQQISELPEEFLPLKYRPSQLMDRSGRRESLTRSGGSQVALPAGYEQQVQKLSVLPDSDIGSKVRLMSERAAQEASPLLCSETSDDAECATYSTR